MTLPEGPRVRLDSVQTGQRFTDGTASYRARGNAQPSQHDGRDVVVPVERLVLTPGDAAFEQRRKREQGDAYTRVANYTGRRGQQVVLLP